MTEQHVLLAHRHQGIVKTIERLLRDYYFLGIRKIVTRIVIEYDTYIRNKAARHAPYSKLKSLDTPSEL